MEKVKRPASGYDFGCQIEEALKMAVRQAMIGHTLRVGCDWEKDAYEGILALPSFKAAVEDVKKLPSVIQLGDDMELFEKNCVDRAA